MRFDNSGWLFFRHNLTYDNYMEVYIYLNLDNFGSRDLEGDKVEKRQLRGAGGRDAFSGKV